MKKIVVASDSFKGSLTSLEVAAGAEQGIHEVFPECEVVKVNVADGGEGTMDALRSTLGGQWVTVAAADPLGRPRDVSYVVLGDGNTAVIEMSAASGLPLLEPQERNPMLTSTFGTGEMIVDALSRGCRRFLVGIGGSATNDAGMGMLEALGFRFIDKDGKVLPGRGESMSEVVDIDMSHVSPEVKESEFIIACDVDSPFCGPRGAAYVFSPQKGADPQMVAELDAGMEHLAEVIARVVGKDIKDVPGAGAAGGLGGGFLAFLNARLERGIEMVLDAIGFDDIIRGADLVITGEGRVDSQTLTGKTPFGIMKRARKQGIPTVAVGGSVKLGDDDDVSGFDMVIPVTPEGMPLEEAMKTETASANVRETVKKIMLTYKTEENE
jgi:glycerate kinase